MNKKGNMHSKQSLADVKKKSLYCAQKEYDKKWSSNLSGFQK